MEGRRHACWACLLCSKFGVTMCFTGPSASMAVFNSGSSLTGLCTHKLPSDSLTTAPLPFTSIPSQVNGLSAPHTFSVCCVSTRPMRAGQCLRPLETQDCSLEGNQYDSWHYSSLRSPSLFVNVLNFCFVTRACLKSANTVRRSCIKRK